ncbi:MAG: response regulator [Rariglobus sp.]
MITILYAEDDENDVFFMQRAFAKAGGPEQLVVVPDGQKAVDYVLGRAEFTDREVHPLPSLVMLDVKMPHLTGIEALRVLREEGVNRELPVVMLTSSTQQADIAVAHQLGANGYFVKPSNANELIGLLKNLTVAANTVGEQKTESGRLEIEGNRLPLTGPR